MNSQKITQANHSAVGGPNEVVPVRGKFYNDLHTDVETIETDLATTQAAVDAAEADQAAHELVFLPDGGWQSNANVKEYTDIVTLSGTEIVIYATLVYI